MAGVVMIPRDVIDQLANDADLLALHTLLVSRARYSAGRTARGDALQPGELVTGKKAIAAQFNWTESSAYRALRRLQDRTLIELRANRVGTIVRICDWPSYALPARRRRTTIETSSKRNRTDSGPCSNHVRTPTKSEVRNQEPPPPNPSAGGDDSVARWEEAEEVLISIGLGTAAGLIDGARHHRCSPEEIHAVVAHWRRASPAWGLGGLAHRLENLRPGQDPATPSLWPPHSKAATIIERSSERAEAAADARRRREEAEALRSERRAREQRLEQEHGGSVDCLGRAAIRDIIAARSPADGGRFLLAKLPGEGRVPPGSLRIELLEHFESQLARTINGHAH